MVGIKVKEVQSKIKIGAGRTLNDCFITKNGNVASNIKLPKIENITGIMEWKKYDSSDILVVFSFILIIKSYNT